MSEPQPASAGASFASDAGIYDRSRRQLIPRFDDFYGTAVRLVPFDPSAPIDVLDLGAGTGLLSSFIAVSYRNARFTLIDAAPEMLELARRRLDGKAIAEYQAADIGGFTIESEYDAVVSALAIHHLPDDDKRTLFRRVFDSLRPGGVFVNADQVMGDTAAIDAQNRAWWLEDAHAAGVSDDDLAAAIERMTHDRTATLDAQLAWLSDAAFGDVACSFKHGMFAVYSGRKPG